MIKRLIFDLDNTLIMWKKEYSLYAIKLLDSFNKKYDKEYLEKMEKIIDNYSDLENILTKDKLLKAINEGMNENYPYEFVEELVNMVSECSDKASDELINTLDYLSEKYDLVVLSNWFSDCQRKRLEKAGIDKYFSNIYGPLNELMKPNKNSFIKAMGTLSPNECIMIGDDIVYDIEGASRVEIDTILCNFNNRVIDYNGKVIYKIEELIDIL
jgi:HAD superfamily hydrolase (TIGR01549 family)